MAGRRGRMAWGYDRKPDAYGDPHARVNSGTDRFPAAQLKLAFCHTGVAFPRRDTLGPLEPWRYPETRSEPAPRPPIRVGPPICRNRRER